MSGCRCPRRLITPDMFRSACDFLASKAGGLDAGDTASDEDSSKENSVVNGQGSGVKTPGSPSNSPWGHTLTPKTPPAQPHTLTPKASSSSHQRLVLNNSTAAVSNAKQNVPWSDLSFAAEVVSPGFASRVVKEAHNHNTRSPVESRRQYPTAQERYVRTGVLPNVRLGGRTKTVLTPRRTPTSPLLPLGRSSSSTFSSSLSSDFLTSSTPRMPDIRSVASVLEPTNSSSECVRDPTSVQAVVAALQQAQVGKGIKRGSCYMEPEDLSKRQKCSTTGSLASSSLPINYSRDFLEEEQNCGSNSTTSGGGGEKRALDLSPGAQGNPWQLSPENKKRCVLDPMVASFSSSKHIMDLGALQTNGRDTPYSMYDSRRDTDSESNPSVESGQTKNSEQSLHQQTSEATGGESCVISPGPSERDPSDRSGSHTPQSTRGEGSNSSGGGGQGGTANTSRTSTPRNPTPPRPTHVISLEAYKADKAKSQQRLKKMLDMLFPVKETESRPSKSGESTPSGSGSAFSLAATTSAVESSATSLTLSSTHGATSETSQVTAFSVPSQTGGAGTLVSSSSLLKGKTTKEDAMPSSTVVQTASEGTKNEVSASFTFSLKPASTPADEKDGDSGSKDEGLTKDQIDGDNDVSVTAVVKLPTSSSSDNATKTSTESATTLIGTSQEKSSDAPVSSPLVDFLKANSSAKDGTNSTVSLDKNPRLCSKTPAQLTCTNAESNQLPGISPLTFTSSVAVNQGNTGIFTVGQTSASSEVTSVTSPAAFSVTLPQAGNSVSNFLSQSVPQTNSVVTTTNIVENAQSSPVTSLIFGSNNKDKSVTSQQPTNEGSSGSSNPSAGNGMSGFFNNTSNATKLTAISQAPTASSEKSFTVPLYDQSTIETDCTRRTPSSSAKSLATSQEGLVAQTASSLGSLTAPSTNPSTVISSGFFNSTPSSAMASPTSQGGLDALMTTSAVGSFTAPSTNPSTVMSPGFFSTMSSTPKSSATSQGGLDSPMTTSVVGSLSAPSNNPSASLFTFGSGSSTVAPQQSSFTFLDPKKTTSSAESTTGSTAPVLGFSFGTSQASNSTTLPFGSTGATQTTVPSASSGFNTGLPFGSQTGSAASSVTAPTLFGTSTISVTAPPPNATTAVATTTRASPFSFGQNTTAQPTTTASPFTFGSAPTHGGSGTSSTIFQFGGAAASAATATTVQPFAPAVVSTQSNTAASSLFTFGTPGTTTAPSVATTTAPSAVAPSPFTFGLPKPNATAPTFGTTTNASVKAAPSAGFGFGTVPAATSTTAAAPSTGFTFGSSVTTPASGFPFGAANKPSSTDAKSSSPFTFGNTDNKTNFGAGSSSPFSFGGNTSAAPAFGSNPSQGFGAPTTSTPTFGISTPSFGTATSNPASPFGSSNTFGATSPNSSFNFGTTANSNKTNSGANPFGVQGTAPSFGAASNTASPDNILTGSGGFNSTQNPTFGTPTFGSDNTATSKGAAFQFGQGTSNPPSFGAAAASTTFRGATNPPTFGGATNPPTFGGATSPTFGGGASATGAPGGPVFQFGASNPPSFNTGNNPSSNAPRRPRARVRGRNR